MQWYLRTETTTFRTGSDRVSVIQHCAVSDSHQRVMRIFNQNLRLQHIVVMYFTGLALLMVIMVASYPAPSNAVNVSDLKPEASIPLPPLPMPYQVSLDPRGELQLAWNISDANQEVYIRLTATAKLKYGVVLGMSDRGELTNADLVVLWDSGAKTYFGVSHSNKSISQNF